MTTASTTVTDANKDTVRHLFASFAASDDAAFDRLLAPDFVCHGMPPGVPPNADGLKQCSRLFHAGLTECSNVIEDLVAEGDRVVVRYTTRAVHSGELFGVLPSGRTVTLTGIEIYRVYGGRVAEAWFEGDMSDLSTGG